MVKLVFLRSNFYEDFKHCTEIEQKLDRPHVCIVLMVNDQFFCIPMRSNISHPYSILTDEENHCGLDLTKTVIITDPQAYIDYDRKPHLRETEYRVLKRLSEYDVKRKLKRYIKIYKRAKEHPEARHNIFLLKYSCLQYFEEFL